MAAHDECRRCEFSRGVRGHAPLGDLLNNYRVSKIEFFSVRALDAWPGMTLHYELCAQKQLAQTSLKSEYNFIHTILNQI